jgi:serine/threonine protein kinase
VTVDEHSQGTTVGPGATFGGYRVLSEVGRGGMGIVYLAEHSIMGRKAAIKVLLPEYSGRDEVVTRFFNEARAAARLQHPAFVDVFDCGITGDYAFMVMEYVVGASLTAVLEREGRLPLSRALNLTRVIAEAMAVAHQNGIIHRDLKPDNIILPDAGNVARLGPHPVKILDFGIAKLNTAGSLRMTKTGMLMGTPLYMSPEQCRGSGNLDARTDIYSLGCLLYAMLTGSPPFPRGGDGEILVAHTVEPVPPLEKHGVSVPAALEAVLMKALAKDPADRQTGMTELVRELAAADGSPNRGTAPGRAELVPRPGASSTGLPQSPPRTAPSGVVEATTTFSRSAHELPRSTQRIQRRRPPWMVGGAILLGVAGALAVMLAGRRPAPRPVPAQAPPVVEVKAPPPAVIPAPPPPPPPAPAQTVIVLDSDPPGATVVNAGDQKLLGTTPLRLTFERSAAALPLRLEKRGFKPETIEVNLGQDLDKTVTLRPRARVFVDPDESRKL